MIIEQAVIEGFGKWYDETIDFQTEGLTCFYGKNESGKSTLYHFILFMLFGLPPKKRELYRPKTGAKMGGRLVVTDKTNGTYTIERHDAIKNGAAVCYTSDGEIHGEEWLTQTWNGMTFATYQSIFSFAANDLADIDKMKGEDLGNVLLSIGLTGAKNIQEVEKQLDNQMAQLFKPYGKKPVINDQLATLNESFQTLKQAGEEEKTYREMNETLSALEAEQQQLKMALQTDKQSLHACEKKLQTRTLVQQYHHYYEQLAAYPDDISFPEDGIQRLESVKEQLLPLKSEQAVLNDSLQTYKNHQQKLREEQYNADDYERASELLKETRTYMDITKEQEKLQETKQQKETELRTKLDQLNIGVTEEDLENLPLTFYTEDVWNKLAHDTNQIKLEWEQFEQEERVAVKQQTVLKEDKTAKEEQTLSEEDLQNARATIESYQRQSSEQTKKNEEWRTWKQKRKKIADSMLVVSIIMAFIAGIFLWPFTTKGVLIVPVLLFLGGAGLQFGMKRSIRSMEKMLDVTPLSSDVTEPAYHEAKQQMEDHERNTAELAAINEQIKKNDRYLLTLSERRNTLDMEQKRLNQRIDHQYAVYPFLEQVDIAYWLPLYHTLQQVSKLHDEIKQLDEQFRKIQQHKSSIEQHINLFFQRKNWESANETIEQQNGQLEQLIADSEQIGDRIEQYKGLIQEQTEQLEAVNKRLAVYEQEREDLFKAAAVSTEETFFRQAKKQDDKRYIQTKLAEIKDQLSAYFSSEEWERWKNATMDEQQLLQEREEFQSSIDSNESELETNRQKIADLSAEISRLETSDRYSERLHRFHMEKEELEGLAEKWSVLKTAKTMLEETKRKYRDKYIVKVMDKTTSYFQALTNQTYRNVLIPEDESPMQVVADDEQRYAVHELSKGTMDQLYVSLRLAISETMMTEHGFPFIIDDAFVHFDSIRTNNVMEILDKMAEKQQIIVLSCKEDVKKSVYNGKIVCLENTVSISS